MTDPIFQSQLPNAYNSPLNFGSYGAGPESSGWNVNSAYLTPTFMAGYRPNYGGPQNMSMPYMGFWRGANVALPTPWQPDTPYYMDAAQYRTAGFQAAGNKAIDVAMTGAQFAAGIAISAGVGSFLSNKNFFTKAAGFGEMAMGGNSMGRMGATMGKGAGHVMSLAARGAAGAVGWVPLVGPAASGALRGAAAMMPEVGGMAGAFTGGMLLPFTAGLAAAEVANQAIFTPYVAGRQGADVVSNYFRGMGTGLGTSSDPLSVSSFNANRIGFNLASTFSRDLSWKPDTGAQTLQFGLQEGLYKNLSGYNASTITKRTKEIANQVKLVMDAFNEPSMQEAIKMLGQLSTQGGLTGTGGIAQLSHQYKMASIATGVNTRELMGTVGMQGQMMYGQAGLVPVLGQMAALNSITGISAAHKSGLINTATLAMMGGLEGASQLAMQANMGLAGSQYNKIMAFMQYTQGKGPNGLVNNLSNFGNFLAGGNPLRAAGAFGMNADKAVSAQLANNPTAALNVVFDQLKQLPGARNDKGQYYAEVMHSLMVQQGMSPQQAEAMLRQYQGFSSPDFMRKYQLNAGAEAQSAMEKALEQEGLLYAHTGLGNAYYQARSSFRNLQGRAAEFWKTDSEKLGLLGDQLREWAFGEFSGAAPRVGMLRTDTSMSDKDFYEKTREIKTVTGRDISWNSGATASNRAGSRGRAGSIRESFGIDAIEGYEGWGTQGKYKKLINQAEDAAAGDPAKKVILEKARTGRVGPADLFQIKETFGFGSEKEAKDFVSAYSTATITTTGDGTETTTEWKGMRTNLNTFYEKAIDALSTGNPSDAVNYGEEWAASAKGRFKGMSNLEIANFQAEIQKLKAAGVEITEANMGAVINQLRKTESGIAAIKSSGYEAALGTGDAARLAGLGLMGMVRVGATANLDPTGRAFAAGEGARTDRELASLARKGMAAETAAGSRAMNNFAIVNSNNLSSLGAAATARVKNWERVKMQYDASGQIDFSGMMNVFLDTSMEAADKTLEAANTFKASVRAFSYARLGNTKGEEAYQQALMAAQGEVTGQ